MKKILSSLFLKYMVIFVGVLLATNVIASIVAILLFGELKFPTSIDLSSFPPIKLAVRIGFVSMIVGTGFIFGATKIVLRPINSLSEAAKSVAEGNFDVAIETNQRRTDEISELTTNFNFMIHELSKNEYLHKDFVSNVSHEFKTPIAAISGYAELLSSPNLPEEKRLEYAGVISKQTNRLAKLSSDLLRLSELESENVHIKKTNFSLDEQLRDAILLLQNEWEQKNIELDVTLEKTSFVGDKALLYQVWVNIISNAIRYTQSGGKIAISLATTKGQTAIKVQDNGIGMTKEQNERIFERFYRADTSRTTAASGLGLSIAKRIITLHGGTIKVLSNINEGTIVYVAFECENKV